jgi:urease accessory protein
VRDSSVSDSSRWHGQVDLRFIPDATGKTLAQLQLARAPFKVQRAFYPEATALNPCRCYTTLLHTAGGMVAGDQLTINLTLEPQAQALITTAAASKIYGGAALNPDPVPKTSISETIIPKTSISKTSISKTITEQQITINLAPGASLEWLPQETILFDGADYTQTLQIELGEGASCLGWDITRFGRTARGERFRSGTWQSQTEVWRAGRPLWIDPQWLAGGSDLLDSPLGLAGQPLIGTLFWLGAPPNPALIEALRQAWYHRLPPSEVCRGEIGEGEIVRGEAGVTQVEAGIICRYRGSNRQELHQWFVQVWQLIRQAQGQPVAQLPRVWPL